MPTRVLIVTTSHATLGATGKATGLWLEELATPYRVFRDAGFTVEIASIAGGKVPLDPRSIAAGEHAIDDELRRELHSTPALASVDPSARDALFLPGGHGTMWDLPADEHLARAVARTYDEGRIVAAVCHGPAGLIGAVRSDGKPLVAGRRVTGFTNAEEGEAGLRDSVPFLLESRLRELGALFEHAPPFEPFVVRDGNLITGQNPQSSAALAKAVVSALQRERPRDPAMVAHDTSVSGPGQPSNPSRQSSSSSAS